MKLIGMLSLVFGALLLAPQFGGPSMGNARPPYSLAPLFSLAQPLADPSYFGSGPNWVWFLQWTESHGSLSGQLQEVYTTLAKPFNVQNANEPVTGTRNGSDVTLSIGGVVTWTGVLRGNTLTLTVPQGNGLLATIVLRAGTVEDYNKAAVVFHARIAQEAAVAERERQRQAVLAEQERQRLAIIAARRRAVTEADDAVGSALHNLSYNLSQLTEHSQDSKFQPVLESYTSHLAKMQTDYEQLKSHAAKRPFDCYQLSVVNYDLSTLEYDLSLIQYDNSTLEYVRNPMESDLQAITKTLAEAKAAMQHLQSAIATNVQGSTRSGTVYLENYSTGNAAFYVDGQLACTDPSGCTVVLQGPHRLYALTSGLYRTPETTLTVKEGEIYRYVACGAMGVSGQNCGLFVVSTPGLVEAFTLKANQQTQASRKILERAAGQRTEYNRNAEGLLQDARNFVSSLTCSQ